MPEQTYSDQDAKNAISAAETYYVLVTQEAGAARRAEIIAGQIRLAKKALEMGMPGPAVKMAAAAILL